MTEHTMIINSMYIEFKLPSGAGGMAAIHYNRKLAQALDEWSDKQGLSYEHTLGRQYHAEVRLGSADAYVIFSLTWPYSSPKWVIVGEK